MKRFLTAAVLGAMLLGAPAFRANAQAAVVGVANPDALFFSKDPKLNRNKHPVVPRCLAASSAA